MDIKKNGTILEFSLRKYIQEGETSKIINPPRKVSLSKVYN